MTESRRRCHRENPPKEIVKKGGDAEIILMEGVRPTEFKSLETGNFRDASYDPIDNTVHLPFGGVCYLTFNDFPPLLLRHFKRARGHQFGMIAVYSGGELHTEPKRERGENKFIALNPDIYMLVKDADSIENF